MRAFIILNYPSFQPFNCSITPIFAAILVFTFYGKIKLFYGLFEMEETRLPWHSKEKSSNTTTVHQLLDDSESMGQTNYQHPQMEVLWSAWTVPVCTRDCSNPSLIKLTSFALWDSLCIEFFSLYSIFLLENSTVGHLHLTAGKVRSNTGPKQGRSLCATLQYHFYKFHYSEYVILEIIEEHCHKATD